MSDPEARDDAAVRAIRLAALAAQLAVFVAFHARALSLRVPWVFEDVARDSLTEYVPYLYALGEQVRHGTLSDFTPTLALGTSLYAYAPGYLTDPFTLPTLFFGGRFAVAAIPWVLLAKSLTTSLAIDAWLRRAGLSPRVTPIAGVAAALSGYMLTWDQHYAYTTCLPLLALVLYTAELRAQRARAWPLVLTSFLAAALAPMWGFQILLGAGLVVLGREIVRGGDARTIAATLARVAGPVLLGVALAAFVLVPASAFVLSSPRSADAVAPIPWRGGRMYTARVLARLLANDLNKVLELAPDDWWAFYEDPAIAMTALLPFAIAYVASRSGARARVVIAVAAVTALAFVISPRAASLWNGFSTPYTRFTFVYVPPSAAALAAFAEALGEAASRRARLIAIAIGLTVVGVVLAKILRATPLPPVAALRAIAVALPQLPLVLVAGVVLVALAPRVPPLTGALLLLALVTLDLSLGARRHFTDRRFAARSPVAPGGHYRDAADAAVVGLGRRLGDGARLLRVDGWISANEGVIHGYATPRSFLSFDEPGFRGFLDAMRVAAPEPGNAAVRGVGLEDAGALGLVGVTHVVASQTIDDPFLERPRALGPIVVQRLRAASPVVSFVRDCAPMDDLRELSWADRGAHARAAIFAERCPARRVEVPPSDVATTLRDVRVEGGAIVTDALPDALELRGAAPTVDVVARLDPPLRGVDVELAFVLDLAVDGQVTITFEDDLGHATTPPRVVNVPKPSGPVRVALPAVHATRLRLAVCFYARARLRDVHVFQATDDRASLAARLEAIEARAPRPRTRARFVRDDVLAIDVAGIAEPLFARIAVPYSAGFSARVNGRPARLFPVDGGLVGLALAPGDAHIELTFDAVGQRAGRVISALALAVFVAWIVRARRARLCAANQRDA